MDNTSQQIEARFNGIVVFFYALLIYFLPISIALTETMASFAIFFFLIKKILLIRHTLRLPGPHNLPRIILKSLCVSDSGLNKPIGIFLSVMLISVFHSQYFYLSLIAFLGKTVEGYLLYLAFVDCFKFKAHFRNFLAVYLVSTLLMGINGIAQYLTHTEFVRGTPLVGGRVSSSLRHANDFGAYLLYVLPVLLSLLFLPYKKISPIEEWKSDRAMGSGLLAKIAIFILFVIILTCEGLTFSRGSWVGFLLSLCLFAFLHKRGYFQVAAIAVTFLIVFMPFMIQARDVSFVSDNVKVQEEVDRENKPNPEKLQQLPPIQRWIEANKHQGFSGMGRTGFWAEALGIIKKHPLLGSGLNSYSQLATLGYPHNCYLQMAAETGIVGLLSFLSMIVFLYWQAIRALPFIDDSFIHAVLVGSLAGLFGFFVQSFLDTTFYSVQLGNLMWVFMGLIVALQRFGGLPQKLTKTKGSI